ncbi:MAG: 4-(cytidine 5'-diphospho)-2-C-methyl-D-erythritol kinase [Geminicoccaceae bacterium]
MRRFEEQAPAKVNLCLRITGRRPDGYHELDSCVVFTEWADRLTIVPDDRLTLELTGPFAPALAAQSDNLVIRAARRLAAHAGRIPGGRLILDKRIPVTAGLGGGSADAAATLRGLDRVWDLGLASSELLALALELGADVPVCLVGRSARMRGIGERLEPIELPVLDLVLANPRRAVPTARAFAGLGPIGAVQRSEAPPPRSRSDLLDWLRGCPNDLEAPARRLEPLIDRVLEALGREPGCRLARMTGSGATCFGVFDDRQTAARAAAALRRARPEWWVAATATRAP